MTGVTRRALLQSGALVVGAAALPLLAGCGGTSSAVVTVSTQSGGSAVTATQRASTASPAAPASSAPAGAAIQLTFGGEDNTYVAAGHKAEVDDFNKQHSGIRVTYLPIASILGAQPSKLLAMFAGGSAPDFFQLSSSYYAAAVPKGVLLDITSYVDRSKSFDTSDFFPVVWTAYLYRNRVFAIPREGAPTILFINEDLFQKAGVKPPPQNVKDADWWTTSAFLDAATRLTQRSGANTDVYGFGVAQGNWIPFLFSFGGDILDSDNSKCLLDSAASQTTFGWLQDSLYKQRVAPTPDVMSKTTANKLFEAGGAAMLLNRRSQSGEYAKAVKGFTWKAAPFPKGPAGRISDMISNAIALWAETKHPAEAFEAATFMESTQGHLIRMQYAQQIGVPQRKSVVASEQFLHNVMTPEENQLVVDQIATAKFQPPMTPIWPQVDGALGPALTQLWKNEKKPGDVLGPLTSQVNALLAGAGS